MGYSMVEWDRVVLHNDYRLISSILQLIYIISKGGVTYEKVKGCRFG